MKRTKFLAFSAIILMLLALFSCKQQRERHVRRGFYYWKTNLNLKPNEQACMDSVGAKVVYLRLFDVDIASNGKDIKPIAIANFGANLPSQQIVPVVFITPAALNAMKWNTIGLYAERIVSLIQKKTQEIDLNTGEVQIDCDWTESNKELYFAFLRQLKRNSFFIGKQLSVTIRLHQVKYLSKTGVPPADKGLLMVYNIDKLADYNVDNSILNANLAKQYLGSLNAYPLPLDIALPIYSWTLLFQNEKLNGIIRNYDRSDFDHPSIFETLDKQRFLVLQDTVFKGYPLLKGQVLRFENSDLKTVLKVADFISEKIASDSLNLLLYHCDSVNFSKYTSYELEKIYNSFD